MEADTIQLNEEQKINSNVKIKASAITIIGKKNINRTYHEIPFRILITITRKKNPIDQATIKIRPINEKEVNFESNDNNQFSLIEDKSVDVHYDVISHVAASVAFNISYLEPRKEIKNIKLIIPIYPSIIVEPKVMLFNTGFILHYSIENKLSFAVNDINLETSFPTFPRIVFQTDQPTFPSTESEFDMCEELKPDNIIKTFIHGDFFPPKERMNIGTFTIKYTVPSLNRTFSFTKEIVDQNELVDKPFAFSLIGQPDKVPVLTPFNVKVDIFNNLKAKASFSLEILTTENSTLLPYGKHYYSIDEIGIEPIRISMEFIAITEGLLKYPQMLIKSDSCFPYNVDFNDGVFAIAQKCE
ncbi:hypothetical protein TVAG_032120 [Trichomonas vaginalis G3]|uniref:Uncharacterized protein n=1 Tax=Trichomonas vaginalis (strain ATCC PRA-98 / G3) TaxID=412133 RepID=A2FIE7_TRIV3|nr:hypothetical protein TVAGG3_0859610 [Trichomonas vaginalis G3]EAX95309.1 hypothetical protein TVAG_032120 [Trichomonas vaginalis G3]KAI5500576.1 hypothetical protein TVAGG3_0859610 [Trichomonas vaginalis G3]|eukprot:XP_001308239.1 hypothetical protein [Trichomonas vaginalis G3]